MNLDDARLFQAAFLVALLLWLVARGRFVPPRHRRRVEIGAFVVLGCAMLAALVNLVVWSVRGG